MANPKFPRMFSTNHSNAGGDPFCLGPLITDASPFFASN